MQEQTEFLYLFRDSMVCVTFVFPSAILRVCTAPAPLNGTGMKATAT